MGKYTKAANDKGDARRAKQAELMRRYRAASIDIDSIPEPKNLERRESCRNDLRKFCETYRPEVFNLEWSSDHLRVIAAMENIAMDGGLMALAMPRGSGKTSLSVTAGLWSILYGHRKWVCLVGATGGKAEALLKSIKTELRFNPMLFEDFPEVCHPIRALEGRPSRTVSQTVQGIPTNIQWNMDKLVFPTVEGSSCSGATVSVCGITGDIRGQQETTSDGRIIRPDLCVVDDPQTRESSASEKQCNDRLETLSGDILGLAGPNVKIACIVPCTVINQYDAVDRLLSDEFKEWKSFRTKMLYGKPDNPAEWERYAIERDRIITNDLPTEELSRYYIEHQEALEAGLEASWPQRKNDDDVSAIMHCYNLRLRDERAFLAEYQNEPEDNSAAEMITAEELRKKQHPDDIGKVPGDSDLLVAFADVQKNALYWIVMAFRRSNFTSWIVDYGHWPQQPDMSQTYRNLRIPAASIYQGESFEYILRDLLEGMSKYLLDKEWHTASGEARRIERMLIDANWGVSRDVIYEWINKSQYKSTIFPSHGKFVGASSEPLNSGQKASPKKFIGKHWRMTVSNEMPIRYFLYDTNFWKSFSHERLATGLFQSGSSSLPKVKGKYYHDQLINNLRSEYPITVEGRGRVVREWKLKPGEDNHWLDGFVGCHVAASSLGARLESDTETAIKMKGSDGAKRRRRRGTWRKLD
jgi:hypothetical protein